jgi:NitT/TauT family transport system substrate-binding protein
MSIKLTENFRALFYPPFYATQTPGFHARDNVEINPMKAPRRPRSAWDLLNGTIDLLRGEPMG